MANTRRASIQLTQKELTFLQRLLRSEHHFITDDERRARQTFGRKLSDASAASSRETGVELLLTQLEVSFLQKLTKTSYSFLTMAERDARQQLRLKIRATWEAVQDGERPSKPKEADRKEA